MTQLVRISLPLIFVPLMIVSINSVANNSTNAMPNNFSTSSNALRNGFNQNNQFGYNQSHNNPNDQNQNNNQNYNQAPMQSTTREAVFSAGLPNRSVMNITNPYQNIAHDTKMFGEQLFRGAFAVTSGSTFNDGYVIKAGDNVQVRMWGAYQYSSTMSVDPQGNIFLPNIGPVKVEGVTNGSLQNVIQTAVKKIYRSNVGVYASLESAQPVKVFVTGYVRQPGYYSGLSADSVLSYLDRAGGVDPQRGSYIDIQVLRDGEIMQNVDLYDFLWNGNLQAFSFRDGDVIRVTPQKSTFSVSGKVQNSNTYEFYAPNRGISIADVLKIANPSADATNISISRSAGRKKTSEYYSINQAVKVPVYDGDKIIVTSDRYAGTISVAVQGAHMGNGAVVLPYGSRLKDIIRQLRPSPLADISHLRIYRPSIANQQRQKINQSLDRLEQMTLASQSVTREEANLRSTDAKLIQQFINKARNVQPKGQIVVLQNTWQDVILQQGDIIEIPEQTSVITVNGQVRAQGALTFNPQLTVADYVAKSGGFDNNADKNKILVVHQNGEHQLVNSFYRVQQGDEIMVLPKIKSKNVEVTRGVSQIIYQLAIAAKVILGI